MWGLSMYTYSLLQWFLFFYIYCFIGWVWESCYVSIMKRRWVNRGFMHGPFLPIYGSGAIMVLVTTLPVREHLFLVFLFGMIGATLLEYVTGEAMERIFHVRYWDYSKQRFNVNGHICLMSSLTWGGFSVFMETILHQPIEHIVLALPEMLLQCVTLALTITIVIDLTESFNEAMDLKKMLMNMTENSEEIQRIKKRLEIIVAIVDEQTTGLKERAEAGKVMLAERLAGERDKYEVYLKNQIEKTEIRKLSTQKRLEENLDRIRQKQSSILRALYDKVNTYSDIAGSYTRDKQMPLSEEVEKVAKELKSIKEKLIHTQKNLMNLGSDRAIKSMAVLRRNPQAISPKYAEALKKLKSLGEQELIKKNQNDKSENK